ncbi:hypothetical protein Tco_1114824 [Tanacetum coccineum]
MILDGMSLFMNAMGIPAPAWPVGITPEDCRIHVVLQEPMLEPLNKAFNNDCLRWILWTTSLNLEDLPLDLENMNSGMSSSVVSLYHLSKCIDGPLLDTMSSELMMSLEDMPSVLSKSEL